MKMSSKNWYFIDESIYVPDEDTYFLLNVLCSFISRNLEFQKGVSVCEMGVGNGEILRNLFDLYPENIYLGVDINPFSIEYLMDEFKDIRNMKFVCSDLFESVSGRFDLIFFNAPYLPYEEDMSLKSLSYIDRALYGGENGFEVIISFLGSCCKFLNPGGRVFVLFSNFSNEVVIKRFVRKFLLKVGLRLESVYKKKVFFEELIIYQLVKSD